MIAAQLCLAEVNSSMPRCDDQRAE